MCPRDLSSCSVLYVSTLKLRESIQADGQVVRSMGAKRISGFKPQLPQLLLTPNLAQGQSIQPCVGEAFSPAFRIRMGVAPDSKCCL